MSLWVNNAFPCCVIRSTLTCTRSKILPGKKKSTQNFVASKNKCMRFSTERTCFHPEEHAKDESRSSRVVHGSTVPVAGKFARLRFLRVLPRWRKKFSRLGFSFFPRRNGCPSVKAQTLWLRTIYLLFFSPSLSETGEKRKDAKSPSSI